LTTTTKNGVPAQAGKAEGGFAASVDTQAAGSGREELFQRLIAVLKETLLQRAPVDGELLQQFMSFLAEHDARREGLTAKKRKKTRRKAKQKGRPVPKPELDLSVLRGMPAWDPDWDADRSGTWESEGLCDVLSTPPEELSRQAMDKLREDLQNTPFELPSDPASNGWLGVNALLPRTALAVDETMSEPLVSVFTWILLQAAAHAGDPFAQRQNGLLGLAPDSEDWLDCEIWHGELFRPDDTAEAIQVTSFCPTTSRAALCWLNLAARAGDEIAKAVLLARKMEMTVAPRMLFVPHKMAS